MYVVSGIFRMGKKNQPFNMFVDRQTPEDAKEYVYSVLGGRHKCPRHLIKIERITKLPEEIAKEIRSKKKLKKIVRIAYEIMDIYKDITEDKAFLVAKRALEIAEENARRRPSGEDIQKAIKEVVKSEGSGS